MLSAASWETVQSRMAGLIAEVLDDNAETAMPSLLAATR